MTDVDLNDTSHLEAIVAMLDMYAREPTGAGRPLPSEVRDRLPGQLAAQANGKHFLAFNESSAVGVAICFFGFSTFAARPLLNIHDLAVVPDYRGRGVGRSLLQAAEQAARLAGCCKLTLEVRADNTSARGLYRSFGFESGNEDPSSMHFWAKPFA